MGVSLLQIHSDHHDIKKEDEGHEKYFNAFYPGWQIFSSLDRKTLSNTFKDKVYQGYHEGYIIALIKNTKNTKED